MEKDRPSVSPGGLSTPAFKIETQADINTKMLLEAHKKGGRAALVKAGLDLFKNPVHKQTAMPRTGRPAGIPRKGELG